MEKHRGTRTKLVIFRLFHSYAGYDPRHSGESINLSKFFSFSNTSSKVFLDLKKSYLFIVTLCPMVES